MSATGSYLLSLVCDTSLNLLDCGRYLRYEGADALPDAEVET